MLTQSCVSGKNVDSYSLLELGIDLGGRKREIMMEGMGKLQKEGKASVFILHPSDSRSSRVKTFPSEMFVEFRNEKPFKMETSF